MKIAIEVMKRISFRHCELIASIEKFMHSKKIFAIPKNIFLAIGVCACQMIIA